MRTDAVFRFDNTFDVWSATSAQDPITGQISNTYGVKTTGLKGLVVPSQTGVYLSTREPLNPRDQVRNVRDRNGIYIFAISGEQYVMYVNECNPAYDAYGSIIGYRSLIRRDYKKTFEERAQILQDITG